MNKFNSNIEGGLPLFLDDIRFFDEVFRKAIISLLKGLVGSSGIIVSGVNITVDGLNLVLTSGFIYIKSELLYFPGQTIENYNSSIIYVFKKTEELSGLRLLANSDEHYAYTIVNSIVDEAEDLPEPDELSIVNYGITIKRLFNLFEHSFSKNTAFNKNFANKLQTLAGLPNLVLSPQNLQQHDFWHEPEVVSGWSLTDISDLSGLKYRKTTDNMLQLSGRISRDIPSPSVAFVFPAEYIPKKRIAFSCPSINIQESTTFFTITEDGNFEVLSGSDSAVFDINELIPLD